MGMYAMNSGECTNCTITCHQLLSGAPAGGLTVMQLVMQLVMQQHELCMPS